MKPIVPFRVWQPFAALLLTGVLSAQAEPAVNANGRARDGKSPDELWTEISAMSAPATANLPKGLAKKDEDWLARHQRAGRAKDIAAATKAFYLEFPDHVHARDARKVEAIASLQSTFDLGLDKKKAAFQTASDFRHDSKNSQADRFEVALEMEKAVLAEKYHGPVQFSNPGELEIVADRLWAEFGPTEDAARYYLRVARGADLAMGGRIGRKLIAASLPDDIKNEARALIARESLLGTTLNATIAAADGTPINLANQTGKLTLLYLYPAGSPASLGFLTRAKNILSPDVQLLCIARGATKQELNAGKKQLTVPGTLCTDSNTAPGDLLTLLNVTQLPCVVAIDRSGKISGLGPIQALGSIVNHAAGGNTVNP